RKCETKASAFPDLTFNFDSPSVLRNDLTDNHETKPRAMTAIFRRVKRIKNVTHHFRRHSESGIDEINRHSLRFPGFAFRRSMNLNLTTVRHRIKTVIDQVQEQLLETIRRTGHQR